MKQESHRIYWQQWGYSSLSSPGTPTAAAAADEPTTKKELITSSAAIRISEAARAVDVTRLLHQTLADNDDTSSPKKKTSSSGDDALVLVGTHVPSGHQQLIRFEHEPPSSSSSSSLSSYEPIHVVRTLRAEENPLTVRDEMVQHLVNRYKSDSNGSTYGIGEPQQPSQTGTKQSPQHRLQWFFVPGPSQEVSGEILSCLELDGYCTSMEEDDENDSSDDEEDNEDLVEGMKRMNVNNEDDSISPRKKENGSSCASKHYPQQQPALDTTAPSTPHHATQRRVTARERRRLMALSNCSSPLHHHCVSGYLLKQSSHDVHVWRRVHCVLTDDHMWYVSRVYYNDDGPSIARHGRIALTRALLIEPATTDATTADSNSNSQNHQSLLSRIPYVFEVISSGGRSHVFRAMNQSLYRQWVTCLGRKIVQCHDNNLMEHAELIVEGETVARNIRMASVALPQTFLDGIAAVPKQQQRLMMDVVRFGMEVAAYREQCRHIQAVMPVKSPVIVTSNSSQHQLQQQEEQQQALSPANGSTITPQPPPTSNITPPQEKMLDSNTQNMIHATWDEAAALLTKATHVGFAMSGGGDAAGSSSSNNRSRLPRSIETLCQHVDYIITGRFRPLSEDGFAAEGAAARADLLHDDAPPMDLFDPLLTELQNHAVAAATTASSKEQDQIIQQPSPLNDKQVNGNHAKT